MRSSVGGNCTLKISVGICGQCDNLLTRSGVITLWYFHSQRLTSLLGIRRERDGTGNVVSSAKCSHSQATVHGVLLTSSFCVSKFDGGKSSKLHHAHSHFSLLMLMVCLVLTFKNKILMILL